VSRLTLLKSLSSLVALAAFGWLAASASARTVTVGLGGWQVQSSAKAPQSGKAISKPGFATGSWLHVRPDDAGAVGTEVNALVQTGHCKHVFFAQNMKRCFGYMKRVGSETIPRFAVPWWFRTTFVSHLGHSQYAQLIINGVVGEADVWVNGKRIATRAKVQGDYTRYEFNITRLVHRGRNALALKVYPNDPLKMFTLDNVDWTQIPPDNNTGIQFPIQLHTSGPLALSDAHVVQHDARGFSRANLTVKGAVTNYSARRQTGTLQATVRGSRFAHATGRTITLAPYTTKTFSFPFVIHHPRVWWPYQMGSQPLYGMSMSVRQKGEPADSESGTFGIRTVTTRLIGASPMAPHGSRQFLINGRPFIFRGGGWSENLFLHYSASNTAAQIAMIKNLGLNGIRTEGKQMPENFYEQMDRAGILIDGGFQCCDAWALQGRPKLRATPYTYTVLYNSALTIGENLRNHPSVLNFSWSDNNPTPAQEGVSLRAFHRADFQDPLIASAEYKRGRKLNWSGEKEGPYDWFPPSYWYSNRYLPSDPTRTDVGGAWAFDSEASSGDTVPTLASIRRFMSPFEQAKLWQDPNYNQYHLNYENQIPNKKKNFGYAFGTLHSFDKALKARYGSWSSLGSFVEKSQVMNYELVRAQFEAYIAHSTRRKAPSTGIDYWQLNKGWPSLLWTLYNYDFDQAGSYFGAKKANEELHALYTYDNGTVAVDNLGPRTEGGVSVEANVYSLDGKLLNRETHGGIALKSQQVATGLLHPKVPATTKPPKPARTYFVELLLRRKGRVIDRNVYWLSTQKDLINWRKTLPLPQATMNQYANLKALNSLKTAHVRVAARTTSGRGSGGPRAVSTVTITNTSHARTVAFFIRADVYGGKHEVLPILWSDNDITLWPGESETLRASYRTAALHGQAPVVRVSGWNFKPIEVSATR
jgi:exo-1,4-beta-D-glucosaminidase